MHSHAFAYSPARSSTTRTSALAEGSCYNHTLPMIPPTVQLAESKPQHRSEKVCWITLLAATAASCLFQIAWFWRFRAHNITMDGIAYIGLARHLVDGDVKASLHGYWSPLTSWIIAASALFGRNFTLLGRLVTITSFLLCPPLLYLLTLKLWRSRVAAALSVLWFSTARGVAATAVGLILADFVLTACVLLYFVLLLRVLRQDRPVGWLAVGAAHALTFLAKAIAMPWLAISTVLALLVQNARSPRRLTASLLLAFLFPAAVWIGWGLALRSKYGQFTTGDQLRTNLMINWKRRLSHRPRGDNLAFVDTSSVYDHYMVGESPLAAVQGFSLRRPGMLSMILGSEFQNLPQALKETVILLNPGGVLALAAMLAALAKKRSQYRTQAAFVSIALLSVLSVIVAYCMLVFDARYVIPVLPLLIAISCPALLPAEFAPDAPRVPGWQRKTAAGLLIVGTVFFTVYWASPFRTVDRDFEASCYQAAAILRAANPHGTLASIGDGPYPQDGVGFEGAPYVAYLAEWRLVAANAELPGLAAADTLAAKALATKADALAVWGSSASPVYRHIVETIEHASASSAARTITDPYLGEVGTLFLRPRTD